MENFFKKINIHISDFIITPYASALSTINEDESKLGSAVIDIGAYQTSIAIFDNAKLIKVMNLQIGSMMITKDLAKALSISIEQAERIKILYGSAINSINTGHDEFVNLQNNENESFYKENSIRKSFINHIVSARAEEIVEIIYNNIANNYKNIGGLSKIIITGGGANLIGLKDLFRHAFKKNVRLAKPQPIEGLSDVMKNSAFATINGLLLYKKEKFLEKNNLKDKQYIDEKSRIKKFMNWFNKSVD